MLNEDHKSLYTTWLGEHGSSVMKVARAYTLTSEECQDLAQEILLQAWRSLPKFEGKASAATWFYRVALQTAMNWHRKEKYRRSRQRPFVEVQTIATVGPDSAEQVQHRDTIEQLYKAIRQLPKADTALVLLYLDELSVQLEPRRQELLKLVASLEDETTSEDSHAIIDLVSALADRARDYSWAQNWNLMIPSWREATAIILPTLGGALCGLWSPLDDMGPVFFQAVVGAVIAFEIALGCVWLRFRRMHNQSPPADRGPKALAAGVALENSANHTPQLLPQAPAILILGLTIFLSIMAVLALYQFVGDARNRFMDDSTWINPW